MKRTWWTVLLILILLALGACGGGGETAKIEAGKELFSQPTIGSSPGCSTCHSLEPGTIIVGPSLAGVGSRAAERVPGMSAEEYIRQSILEPDAYVVEGFNAGVMPKNFGDILTEEQLDNLVAFLLSLK